MVSADQSSILLESLSIYVNALILDLDRNTVSFGDSGDGEYVQVSFILRRLAQVRFTDLRVTICFLGSTSLTSRT